MRRWGVAFCALLVALTAAFYYQQLQAKGRAGFPAPDFTLEELSGERWRLSELRGKVVFLNVWATWCSPCRMEMPSMERLHQRLKNDGLVILAISEDEGGFSAVKPFVDEIGATFPVLLDPEGIVPVRYGVTGYPETFLIDRRGQVVHHAIGPADWDSEEVYLFLAELLAQPPDDNGAGASG